MAFLAKSSEDMHPRRKAYALAFEGLQTPANDGILFEHRHLVAFLGEQGSRYQATQAAADDDNAFSVRFHHLLPDFCFAQQMLTHIHRAHQHAQHAMRVDVLSNQKQVGDFGLV